MIVLDLFADMMVDELGDAQEYVREALRWKDTCPDAAALFFELSKEEVRHSDRLHEMAVREMDRARNAGKAATPEALARYNAKHNKWIDKAEKVLTLQKLYK